MELMRKILFTIEKDYKAGQGAIKDLQVDGYEMPTVAEHCDLLYQQGLIKSYNATVAHTYGLLMFHVGNLTAPGYDYLELIRDNDVWEKTKNEIERQKGPNTFEEIAKVAGDFVGHVIKGILAKSCPSSSGGSHTRSLVSPADQVAD